jgi:hypothetical protein
LDILTKSDQWWEARTANGKKGSKCRIGSTCESSFSNGYLVAPSNYLKLVSGRLDTVIEVEPTPSTFSSPVAEYTIPASLISEPQVVYPYKAEALFGCEFALLFISSLDLSARYRHGVNRRFHRTLIQEGRGTRHPYQVRTMVGGKEAGRRTRK